MGTADREPLVDSCAMRERQNPDGTITQERILDCGKAECPDSAEYNPNGPMAP